MNLLNGSIPVPWLTTAAPLLIVFLCLILLLFAFGLLLGTRRTQPAPAAIALPSTSASPRRAQFPFPALPPGITRSPIGQQRPVAVGLLLQESIAPLGPILRSQNCQIDVPACDHLGLIHTEVGALQHALTQLLRTELRALRNDTLKLTVERFNDEQTEKDWLEISFHTPSILAQHRHQRTKSILDHLGCRLEPEVDASNSGTIYRVYLPCERSIISIQEGLNS